MSQTQSVIANLPKPFDLFSDAASTQEKTYNILIMGPPGVGKTTLACQGPAPVVLIDIEKGSHGLVPAARHFPQLRDVDIRRPETPAQVDAIFWAIRRKDLPCRTLVLDTATELQQMHLAEIRASSNAEINTQQDFNKNLNSMRKHFVGFRDLPINFVAITHVREHEDPTENINSLQPDLTQGFRGLARSMMDIIAYMTIDQRPVKGGSLGEKEEKRTLICTPSKKIWAKNRVGITKPIIDPTWKSLINDCN